GTRGTQATQADGRGTGARVARGGLVGTERVEGGVAQEVGNGHVTAGLQLDAVDHGDRKGAFDLGTLDARAGDLDAVQRGGLRGRLLVGVLGECNARAGDGG